MNKVSQSLIFIFIALSSMLSASALTLEDFVLSQSRPNDVGSITQAPDGEGYYQLSDDGATVNKISYKNGESTVVFNSATARDCKIKQWDGFSVSADEGKILLWTASEPIYRHSFKADYYVYEVLHNKLTKLSKDGNEEIATMSPDGRMVAFVKDNNIYINKLDYGTEVAVTTDGCEQ
jgi:dipeptidyl-peptidase-4